MGIYSYELFKFYGVEKIIRIGTCGSYSEDLELLDIVLVDNAYTESNFALTFSSSYDKIIESSNELTNRLNKVANLSEIQVKRGTILTSDGFDYYIDLKGLLSRIPKEVNCLGADMESFGLFHVAKILNKEAASILSVVDSHTSHTLISAKDREKSLNDMIKLALDSILDD
jgi:purine-nucleoside phosphorylase